MKIFVPPIKCQGIKTKLVEWIYNSVDIDSFDCWIEPFMGSGVVGFNINPKKAFFSDINPHLINFYNAIKDDIINSYSARGFLKEEGDKLEKYGQTYYNEVRTRFNETASPFDFLFLNRSGFNGMIRFNRNGKYNVPFCHKPNRFAKAYITKIVNQIDYVHKQIQINDWSFVCQDFSDTIKNATSNDLIYCDPPYLGRHTDYFDKWNEDDEQQLFNLLNIKNNKFILSTWHSNKYRNNIELEKYSANNILTKEHFYHIGAKETNRNAMLEALITNYTISNLINSSDNYFQNHLL
jgi:DNA adenine methylase